MTLAALFAQIKFFNIKDVHMKASVLAVGTELTIGQIINKNAAHISEKLKSFGVMTTAHLTVPDDRTLILQSLHYLEEQSDLIFVTGGLGPTSDDFTRDLIAEWAKLPLNFDENSWQHITERLSARGFAVRDIQRQQCYFPTGAQILKNNEGTANGFHIELQKKSGFKNVFVLPGPPREIEAIWKDSIEKWLKQNTQHLDRTVTKSWDTLGVGESDVALKVENVLKDRPAHLFNEIGYRVHLPYVEVKFTYLLKEDSVWKPWVQQIEEALASITVTRDFLDVAQGLTEKLTDKYTAHLKNQDFTFYDFVSKGYLHNRLSPHLRKLTNWSFKQSDSSDITADFFENETHFMALLPVSEDKCLIIYSLGGEVYQKQIEAPMKSPLMSERRKQYFAEMALVELLKSNLP